MNVSIRQYHAGVWKTHPAGGGINAGKVQLALCFGARELLLQEHITRQAAAQFPRAAVIYCSTAGEIYHDGVYDDSLVLAGLEFKKTAVKTAAVNIHDFKDSYAAAAALAAQLPRDGLIHTLVFSDGNLVNGSELVSGLLAHTGDTVTVTGGMAGDGSSFTSTLAGLNQNPAEGAIVAAGLYGDALRVTHGSQGGWDVFGMEKLVTKSDRNVLFEIDNQSALALYKKYLGPQSAALPGSALLFPLSVLMPGEKVPVVRTILSVNEAAQSMTFAGNVPAGSKVRFMKADFDKLTAAAAAAAATAINRHGAMPVFSLLISCFGRKLILGSHTVEEVAAVNGLYGGKTAIAGFYSYGEIAPFSGEGSCKLHNQTMTVTSFSEHLP